MTKRFFAAHLQLLLAGMVLAGACNSTNQTESGTAAQTDTMTQEGNKRLLAIGTYTRKEGHVDGKAAGIYLYEFDEATGALTHAATATGIINPSYLTLHPSREWLYAVSETAEHGSQEQGSVHAYRLDTQNRSLSPLNLVSSQGKYPCYISLDPSGTVALVANYGGGIAALPLAEGGQLQEASSVMQHSGKGPTDRQEGPHAHMIIPGPTGKYIYAVDLGTDKIYAYTLNPETKQLQPAGQEAKLDPGAGPRHLAFHPTQDWAYVVNELNGTVTAFNFSAETGSLQKFQTLSTLPADTPGPAGCADIHVHPGGKFLYASNRGEVNNIAIYSIDQNNGNLQLVGHQPAGGKTPRSFVIDSSGSFMLVANQDSGNVLSFRIDQNTGLLEEMANTEVPTPVCLKFVN